MKKQHSPLNQHAYTSKILNELLTKLRVSAEASSSTIDPVVLLEFFIISEQRKEMELAIQSEIQQPTNQAKTVGLLDSTLTDILKKTAY